jgi:hypothetical protein
MCAATSANVAALSSTFIVWATRPSGISCWTLR